MAIIRCKIGALRRRVYRIPTIFGMRTLVCIEHLPTKAFLEILSRSGDIADGTLLITS
jgi:hypothetical protein